MKWFVILGIAFFLELVLYASLKVIWGQEVMEMAVLAINGGFVATAFIWIFGKTLFAGLDRRDRDRDLVRMGQALSRLVTEVDEITESARHQLMATRSNIRYPSERGQRTKVVWELGTILDGDTVTLPNNMILRIKQVGPRTRLCTWSEMLSA